MTQDPELQPNEPKEVTKLMVDRPSDFKFHAAYLAYSNLWEKSSQETRVKLNELVSSLSNQEIDYATFYQKMGQYTGNSSKHYPWSRDLIVIQKKSDWRKREESESRNIRHRKNR